MKKTQIAFQSKHHDHRYLTKIASSMADNFVPNWLSDAAAAQIFVDLLAPSKCLPWICSKHWIMVNLVGTNVRSIQLQIDWEHTCRETDSHTTRFTRWWSEDNNVVDSICVCVCARFSIPHANYGGFLSTFIG